MSANYLINGTNMESVFLNRSKVLTFNNSNNSMTGFKYLNYIFNSNGMYDTNNGSIPAGSYADSAVISTTSSTITYNSKKYYAYMVTGTNTVNVNGSTRVYFLLVGSGGGTVNIGTTPNGGGGAGGMISGYFEGTSSNTIDITIGAAGQQSDNAGDSYLSVKNSGSETGNVVVGGAKSKYQGSNGDGGIFSTTGAGVITVQTSYNGYTGGVRVNNNTAGLAGGYSVANSNTVLTNNNYNKVSILGYNYYAPGAGGAGAVLGSSNTYNNYMSTGSAIGSIYIQNSPGVSVFGGGWGVGQDRINRQDAWFFGGGGGGNSGNFTGRKSNGYAGCCILWHEDVTSTNPNNVGYKENGNDLSQIYRARTTNPGSSYTTTNFKVNNYTPIWGGSAGTYDLGQIFY